MCCICNCNYRYYSVLRCWFNWWLNRNVVGWQGWFGHCNARSWHRGTTCGNYQQQRWSNIGSMWWRSSAQWKAVTESSQTSPWGQVRLFCHAAYCVRAGILVCLHCLAKQSPHRKGPHIYRKALLNSRKWMRKEIYEKGSKGQGPGPTCMSTRARHCIQALYPSIVYAIAHTACFANKANYVHYFCCAEKGR